jgi:hypothetical protein
MTEDQCAGCQHLVEKHWCAWFHWEACTVFDCSAYDDTKDYEEEGEIDE